MQSVSRSRGLLHAVRHLLVLAACFGVHALFMVPSTGSAADRPAIVTRQEWNARPPKLDRMKRQVPREIVIHHTGVRQQPRVSLERKLRGFQSFSQNEKRWGDPPYHYYIGVSGRMGEAHDVAYAGDSNTKYRLDGSIQVVLEGHFDFEQPTAAQIAALRELVAWLVRQHKISAASITGHNDHASTDCLGRNLKSLLPDLSTAVLP